MAEIKTWMAILFTIFLSSIEGTFVKDWVSKRNCRVIQQLRTRQNKSTPSRVYKLYIDDKNPGYRIEAWCDMVTDGGGWTVIQSRKDISPHQSFQQTWTEYRLGFGELDGEHWLGLENIHILTEHKPMQLRIDLEDFDGNSRYAQYDFFYVNDKDENFKLEVYGYSGTAGDSLSLHNNMQFSTKDSDNDKASGNCAQKFKGGWWYKSCHEANLNGLYLNGSYSLSFADGVTWKAWLGHQYSLKTVEMKVRPKVDLTYLY